MTLTQKHTAQNEFMRPKKPHKSPTEAHTWALLTSLNAFVTNQEVTRRAFSVSVPCLLIWQLLLRSDILRSGLLTTGRFSQFWWQTNLNQDLALFLFECMYIIYIYIQDRHLTGLWQACHAPIKLKLHMWTKLPQLDGVRPPPRSK